MPGGLVTFRTNGPTIADAGSDNRAPAKSKITLSTPQYLLFLKRSADGHFEPVSGQIDAVLSVREIYRPLPDMLDGK